MIKFEILKEFSGGKSHDKLFLVYDKNKKKRVLKISKNKNKLLTEINSTIYAKNLFEKNNPIVNIYDYGSINYENKIYYYYLMENLGEEYIELDDVIESICLNQDKEFDIKKILLNIFDIIEVFKLFNFSHCDLHTKNIFVHKKTQKIKIIDFGLATIKDCKKRREISQSIFNSYKKCSKSRDKFFERKKTELKLLLKLIRGEISKIDIDSDLSMFITILSIFYKDNKILQELYSLSSQIYHASIEDKQVLMKYFKDKIQYL